MDTEITEKPPIKNSQRENLEMVYGDIVGRLVNDNNNSWQIITLAGILLTVLGTLIVQSSLQEQLVKIFAFSAGIFLTLAMVAGFVSLLVYRDLRRIPVFKRIILGPNGMEAFEKNEQVPDELSLFHTSDLLKRQKKSNACSVYLDDVRRRYDEDFVDYLFFLANLIEIKKRTRSYALVFILFGGFSIAGLLFVQLLT